STSRRRPSSPLFPYTTLFRSSAGRHLMSFSDQALCFMAGANSIFSSERNFMLTEAVPCNDHGSDRAMLATMGLRPKPLVTDAPEPADAAAEAAEPVPEPEPA